MSTALKRGRQSVEGENGLDRRICGTFKWNGQGELFLEATELYRSFVCNLKLTNKSVLPRCIHGDPYARRLFRMLL